ncbi:TIGR03364 family FAD-dependent oxidoreductase [Agromyces sp. SYSU K20354]|uniref:TIGR03364 family FAD-dependent oxidoreductase n=1 Tax=Agromyces cavernae TaxID=2898659 RepID=UPI001E587103|nr:TIGR03364 family FAD-dependent oxidoreductase [Agromyces cavernae]MCD2440800.1 TIGR03364 family FAD-dependent oxidoreductase [Agromyces cavernae]
MSATIGTRFDVAVVGSGIIGLGAALAAVRRGLRVVVVERGSEPSGASIRNFGHLCITPQTGIALRHGVSAREIWLGLARDAGVWLREAGTLVVARSDDELAVLQALADERDRALAPGERASVELLGAAEASQRIPVDPRAVIGGACLPADLQVDPRQALGAIRAFLARRGVEFRTRTTVGDVGPGRLSTSRGPLRADRIVVAVNHDIDQLYPEVAEQLGIVRCGLDMLRVRANLRGPLEAPLLTGWSLLRYGAFNAVREASVLRERLHAERPDLAALDLNQMYTQLPDGSIIVGDTHYRGATVTPFQSEAAAQALLEEFSALFGVGTPAVVERWQGVYASGPNDFLDIEIEPGVHLAAATTGIGMTTGLGLAEHVVAGFADVAVATTTP